MRSSRNIVSDDALKSAAAASSLRIEEDELSAAFDFFDVDSSGKLTAAGLKQRLGAFYRNIPAKEINLLLGEGPFTKDSLRDLLANNELGGYDPVKEAFKVYDPNGTGFADMDMLRNIFDSLGYGDMNEDDLTVLKETADVNRDGKIDLEDFRGMLQFDRDGSRAPVNGSTTPAAGATDAL